MVKVVKFYCGIVKYVPKWDFYKRGLLMDPTCMPRGELEGKSDRT